MGIEIYKKGQAALTRYVAAGAFAALLAWGCYSLFKALYVEGWLRDGFASGGKPIEVPGIGVPVSPALLIAVAVFVAAGFGLFILLNRPSMADLLIDTEQEMKKVSWPTRQEAWASTIVVVVTVVIFTTVLFTFDVTLNKVLRLIF